MKHGAIRTAVVGLALAASATAAWAHHPMEGRTPETLLHGLLSGFGHPIIGIDHLAALVAVACVAALHRSGVQLAVGYIVATLLGAGILVHGPALPDGEIFVALSVVLLGVIVIWRPRIATAWMAGLFAVIGLLHGHALGETIIGAEPTPIAAYLVGLAVMQSAIAIGLLLLVRRVLAPPRASALPLRLAGTAVAVVGAVVLVFELTAV